VGLFQRKPSVDGAGGSRLALSNMILQIPGDIAMFRALPEIDQQARVLAELLGMPDDDALPRLHDLQATQPWLGEAIAEVESLPLAEWQAECTRLFISGHPKTVCPPFASAYREGRMCGAAAEELSGLYARIGLQASSVPPDYLGAMLECAAYLLESEGETGEHWHELWEGQLAPWVPAFAEDLRRHSALELYRAMGGQLSVLFPPTPDA
jgi:TorA maturation chaperone TorD